MNLEHFALLVEFQGLDKQVGLHLKKISTQTDRLDALKKQRELKEKNKTLLCHELENLKKEQAQKEKTLFEKDQLIERSESRKKTATNEAQCRAIENEIALFRPQKEKLEIEVFALMEKIDEVQTQISEHQQFLEGSLKTLNEIQAEVEKITHLENEQIKIIEERIELQLSNSPSSVRTLWQDLSKRFRFNSPLSFVENGTCSECRCSIGRNFESLIEKGGIVEFCPQCKRLLAPRKRI